MRRNYLRVATRTPLSERQKVDYMKRHGLHEMTDVQLQRLREAVQKKYYERPDKANPEEKGTNSQKVALAQLCGLKASLKMGPMPAHRRLRWVGFHMTPDQVPEVAHSSASIFRPVDLRES